MLLLFSRNIFWPRYYCNAQLRHAHKDAPPPVTATPCILLTKLLAITTYATLQCGISFRFQIFRRNLHHLRRLNFPVLLFTFDCRRRQTFHFSRRICLLCSCSWLGSVSRCGTQPSGQYPAINYYEYTCVSAAGMANFVL